MKLLRRRSRVTARPRSSTRIRAASSPRPTSSRCWRRERSKSAWMARGPGATTSSSNASGGPSNTRRSTCGPMPACPRPALGLADISASTIADARIHRLTGRPPTKPTSTSQYPRGSGVTERKTIYKRPETFQINRTISVNTTFTALPTKASFNFATSAPAGYHGADPWTPSVTKMGLKKGIMISAVQPPDFLRATFISSHP